MGQKRKKHGKVHPVRDGITFLGGWVGIAWMLYTNHVNPYMLAFCATTVLGTGGLALLPYLTGSSTSTQHRSSQRRGRRRG